ncbi:MAG: electron transfer flavoprotein-ubiquinone oxidoreductase [Acidobacteriota bacterium]|jgi:electron-transferring-flavoprotein dehydrogenase
MTQALERETLEVDVLIVGAGPAGLSAAIRLAQLQAAAGGDPLSIAVLEKGPEPGAHSLSGAVMDLSALGELFPDFEARGAPVGCRVTGDEVRFLTPARAWRLPITPPPLSNHGCAVVSLSDVVRWLAAQAEALGIDVFSGFPGSELIIDGTRVVGVRTGDRGLDRHRQPTALFEPGVDVRAAVTILCDGVRGNLTKTLVRRLDLDVDRQPQTYSLGIKELWETPAPKVPPGRVIHTVGYPLQTTEFGGAFIYGLPDNQVAIGLVTGLGPADPLFDPYHTFQRLKQHPFVADLLEGGTLLKYGAKALPEGGWYAIPRLAVDGALIAGDAGGFVNSLRLKGIHLAMRTGMLAAEAAFDAIRAGDTSRARLVRYEQQVRTGAVGRELFPVRNVHQAFDRGFFTGVAFAGLSMLTGGWWVRDPIPATAGHRRMRTVARVHGDPRRLEAALAPPPFDRRLTFDRLTAVHHSGTRHREDAPSHLIVHDTDICRTKCRIEYANPCTRYCPANVYEMVDDGAGGVRLQINASNCVHCKTCDIIDPYQIVDWVPPEGGDGPRFEGM